MMEALRDILKNSSEKYKNNVALKVKRDGSNRYETIKYGRFYELSRKLSNYLKGLGYNKGDKIGIIGKNSPEWSIAFFATQIHGFVSIPIDRFLSKNEVKHIINDSGLKVIFTDKKYESMLEDIKDEVEGLEKIFILTKESKNNIYSLIESNKNDFEMENINKTDEAVFLYTSGTTGQTKGVVLTHKNFIANITDIEKRLNIFPGDNFLSFLPVNHAYELTAGFFTIVYSGATIVYCPSLTSRDIINTMKEAKITKMIGVPLIFEKIYNSIKRKLKKLPKLKKFFINLLFLLGRIKRKFDHSLNGTKPIFNILLKQTGFTNIDFFVSGGAALPSYISRFFYLLGVPILQGYGLTETSPVLSCVSPEDIDFYSVGEPLESVKIRIYNPGENGIGEIVARGPNIMQGYYKEKKKTDEVLKRGWFYTGDFGYMENNKLYIKGRLKNVIVSKGWKNIYPEEIEENLLKSDYIEEVIVVGTGEPVAIIFPNYEQVDSWAEEEKVENITEDTIYKLLKKEINSINKTMAKYKRIRKIKIRSEEFPKTSTRKIKRYLFTEKKKTV